MKNCKFCWEKIKDIAIKCRFCNSILIKNKSKNTAWILALLLWWIWMHKIYIWKPYIWIFYILFFWTWIPLIIWIIEGIIYFSITQEKFNKIVNKK